MISERFGIYSPFHDAEITVDVEYDIRFNKGRVVDIDNMELITDEGVILNKFLSNTFEAELEELLLVQAREHHE